MMAEAASATAETASVVVGRLDTQVGTRRRPRSEKIARWMRFSAESLRRAESWQRRAWAAAFLRTTSSVIKARCTFSGPLLRNLGAFY